MENSIKSKKNGLIISGPEGSGKSNLAKFITNSYPDDEVFSTDRLEDIAHGFFPARTKIVVCYEKNVTSKVIERFKSLCTQESIIVNEQSKTAFQIKIPRIILITAWLVTTSRHYELICLKNSNL